MLDDYLDLQLNIIITLKNSIQKGIYSHAYIIETHKNRNGFLLAQAFVKTLFCPKKYTNTSLCENCFQCKKIVENNFTELKILEPDGQWIKKEQLGDLKKNFLTKPIEGNKKIYIIKEANKMNDVCANSLLKFLEEPEDGIIAILLVENKNQLLDTIVSRCQILSMNSSVVADNLHLMEKISLMLDLPFEDNEKEDIIEKTLEFISFNEQNGLETIAYENVKWQNYFKERNQIYKVISILLLFYKEVIDYKIKNELKIFNDKKDLIEQISKKHSVSVLSKKITRLVNIREKLKFNMNSNLLIDKLIIDLKECEEND